MAECALSFRGTGSCQTCGCALRLVAGGIERLTHQNAQGVYCALCCPLCRNTAVEEEY